MGSRCLEPRIFPGLCIDAADPVALEIRKINIVVRIGIDAVNGERPLIRWLLRRLKSLIRACLDIEPIKFLVPSAVCPNFAVYVVSQPQHIELSHIVVELGLEVKDLEFFGLWIELCEGSLKHHSDPEISTFVFFDIEEANGIARLEFRHGKFLDFACLGIKLADVLLAEIGEPNRSVLVQDDVMRLNRRAWQIVLGDNRVRRLASRARQRLEWILPFRKRTEIDGGEVLSLLAVLFRCSGPIRIDAALRLDRLAPLGVAHHAIDDLGEFIGVMSGPHDAFERVATNAVEQRGFLVIRTRNTGYPLCIGKLRDNILRLAKLEVGCRRLLSSEVRCPWPVKIVTDGSSF